MRPLVHYVHSCSDSTILTLQPGWPRLVSVLLLWWTCYGLFHHDILLYTHHMYMWHSTPNIIIYSVLILFIGLPPFLSVSFIFPYPLSPDRTISALIFSGYPLSLSLSMKPLRCASLSSHGRSGWQFLRILLTSCDRVVLFVFSGMAEWNNINCWFAMGFL